MDKLRSDEIPLRRKALLVMAAASGLALVLLALILVLGSCAARLDAAIRQEGSARIEFKAEIPAAVAARLRSFAAAGQAVSGQAGKQAGAGKQASAAAPLFDAAALRAAIAARKGLTLAELSQPTPDSLRGVVMASDLAALAASPDLAGSKAFSYETGPGWAEVRLRLERGDAAAIAALAPGLDPALLEALSPPALADEEDEYALSAEEYRMMLAGILGEKAVLALGAAAIELSVAAPDAVLASAGGALAGKTLSVRLPLLDLMVLEVPVEIRLRWKR